ncbi:MAG: hypothetical protein XD90_0960 [Methanobacterium sp. 42_16]|nr:MAG: hypothetical protein XD90_0960 [Methanobacterium sp. 42_16]
MDSCRKSDQDKIKWLLISVGFVFIIMVLINNEIELIH